MEYLLVELADSKDVKEVKTVLEKSGKLNKNEKIRRENNGVFKIYTRICEKTEWEGIMMEEIGRIIDHQLGTYRERTVEAAGIVGCFERYIDGELKRRGTVVEEDIVRQLRLSLPKKYSVYPPMLLLSGQTLELEVWKDHTRFFPQLLEQEFPQCTHIAVNKPIIESDVMRRPFNLVPVYGNFGPEPTDTLFTNPSKANFKEAFWCLVVQNGITQHWAPRYTMFSRGNIKEKKRVLQLSKQKQNLNTLPVAVDMYSGIGYFTLSYLANGYTVFCWELNPWSIEGLIRGLTANHHSYLVIGADEVLDSKKYHAAISSGVRAFVFNESNEESMRRFEQLSVPMDLQHINLGLLPSSKDLWGSCTRMVNEISNSKETQIHVHENVSINDFDTFTNETLEFFQKDCFAKFLHLEKVKTFAPDVWHVVLDYLVSPRKGDS